MSYFSYLFCRKRRRTNQVPSLPPQNADGAVRQSIPGLPSRVVRALQTMLLSPLQKGSGEDPRRLRQLDSIYSDPYFFESARIYAQSSISAVCMTATTYLSPAPFPSLLQYRTLSLPSFGLLLSLAAKVIVVAVVVALFMEPLCAYDPIVSL